jgi:lipopolysaccharide transport system ATP-binding protein
MSEIVIKAENISKKYQLGKIGYGSLKHDLQSWFARIRGKEDPNLTIGKKHKDLNEEFWALKDVSFDIKQGEAVGIIGKNGAGKSTLLKIMSRTTSPTSGEIKIRGKIASLLEVGTGFHPELTGRENIYLNGAILGMRKKEIGKKFDEIVAFSGVEQFIDTPVKRYSSGMYVRLAFAVAAHLESDILILDEVLAVGDTEFQKKCLGKMDDVARNQGRTVIFVSHNMGAVRDLCKRSILLENGKKIYDNETEKTINEYNHLLRNLKLETNKHGKYSVNRRGSGTISITDIQIQDINDNKRNIFHINETVRFKLSYEIFKNLLGLYVKICLFSSMTRELIVEIQNEIKKNTVCIGEKGSVIIDVNLINICPKEYILYFWLGDKDALIQGNPVNYDIVDDLTEPLIIKAKDENEKELFGFFSLPSKIKILN